MLQRSLALLASATLVACSGTSGGSSSGSTAARSTGSSGAASSSSSSSSSSGSSSGASRANGTVGPWAQLAPLGSGRANHCSTVANGFLVIAGGNHSVSGNFVTYGDVQAAALLDDGGLGPWIAAGQTPSAVSECTMVADGSTLFLVDGIFDTSSFAGGIFQATLSSDAGLSAFVEVGSLPVGQDVVAGEAYLSQGALVTEESQVFTDDGGGALALLAAPQASLGAGSWAVDPFDPAFVGRPEWAFDGTYLYSIGGYDSNLNVGTAVLGAPWSEAGVGAAFATTPLPAATCFGRAVALDGWVFEVGGKPEVYTGAGSTAVFAAPIGDGGALGSWSSLNPMLVGRTDFAMAVGGAFIYVTGGATSGPGDTVVQAARIRF